ncbi:LysR substrate-binding domain-containing protein [Burkholderia sp. JSH-S8]|uniref:LysR substrate-binding domain-containing protein n=1 Tax=Burkholderia stagnalis TaxID=1503054 RepID=UPI0002E647DF|nr:LysR substrate-binding domain-containing protein [Burkholderia stagnalis]WGS45061.1 LysR substrate-binding domain-containing protein [Burkholderia sp. JSH-S8]
MLDLRRLRYFVTVADELHFGRAALRLRIAQPPLTRHIAALEAELGVRLFERSTRAVRLTPEGALFLAQARSVIDAVGEAEATARKIAHGLAGRIVIGYASSIPMSDAFPDWVRQASRSMPDVELAFREVPTTGQRQQIADGTMDVGFGWTAANARDVANDAHEGIRSLVVAQEPLVAAVPAHSPYANRAAVAFAELAAQTFVTFPPGLGSALNVALEDLCAQAGVVPRVGATAAQITTLVSLVAAERGVAIVPGFTATLQRPGVAYVPLAARYVVDQIVMWREPFASACVERFVGLARELE